MAAAKAKVRSATKGKLAEYAAKRDFALTPEPSGGPARSASGRSFVIQKHAARRLHYDFRLELDGVLKSWAVTKGPSLDPADRRLAVHTEDHPLDYGGFEGVIPQGQYGGGTVMLWDRGDWEPVEDPRKGYAAGKLKFLLHGDRLHGLWTLVRMKGREERGKENWLLIKDRDEAARPGESEDFLAANATSVTTGRNMDAIAADKDRVWDSKVGETTPAPAKPARRGKAAKSAGPAKRPPRTAGSRKAALPDFVEPQTATLAARTPAGPDWWHEIKFDGYRTLCRLEKGEARLLTRSGLDWTDRFGPLAGILSGLSAKTALLDGEIVVLNEHGVSEFRALQEALKTGAADRLSYFLFDVLHLDGRDLTGAPLRERKPLLPPLVEALAAPAVQYSDHWEGKGPAFFRQACNLALEGVVSKRPDAPYRSGRGRDWIKSKCIERQEFVIGGYSRSDDRARGIRSLLVGYYEAGELVYAGRVGTGFTEATMADLRAKLKPLVRKTSPFAKVPAEGRRGAVWVEPELVCEVEFLTWTQSGVLRHASFQGLREDKAPDKVRRENAAAVGEGPEDANPMEGGSPRDEKPARRAPRRSAAPAAEAPHADLEALGVRLTSPDKVLYVESGFTKRTLADYYAMVGEWMLPHIAGRPLSLVRCPEGSDSECFFQRHPGAGMPEAIDRIQVREKSGMVESIAVSDLRGLISLVQIGALEIHPWGSRIDDSDRPDRLVFDLDPDVGLGFDRVVAATFETRDFLADLGLTSFVKTTGGKGLHVVVPIMRKLAWPEAKAFTKAVAVAMATDKPAAYTANLSKKARGGRIFIDYLRNDRSATAVGAYSTRARKGAPVSVPVHWDEVSPKLDPRGFTVANMAERMATAGADPWADIGKVRQGITAKARKKLGL